MKKAMNCRPPKMFQLRMPSRDWLFHDHAEIERAGAQHDADQRQAERQLVADQLRRGAQRAEQGVLVVRRPAGKRDAVDADGRDAEDDEQADVDVGDLKEAEAVVVDVGIAEGNDGDGDERAAKRDDGSEQIERLVDRRWESGLP